MKTRTQTSTFILTLAVLICFSTPLFADRGSIPFEAEVQVFEPNQRALIAWNGIEELLLLTTDLYASKSSKILEVLPLPSEPEVTKGDIEVFQRATNLINEHLQRQSSLSRSRSKGTKSAGEIEYEPAGEITFHETIGAHDISVAHVINNQGFIEWVDEYLKSEGVENPQIPVEMKTVIAEYLEVGCVWFVFDVVQLDTAPKTNEVIQYRFYSTALYYPLKITRTEEGYTTIDLLILTPESRWEYEFIGIPESRIHYPHEPIPLSTQELQELYVGMYDFFGLRTNRQYGPYLEIWQIEGELSSFKNDLIVTHVVSAVKQGRIDIVNSLVANGADVNVRDRDGWTALMRAACEGHTEIVHILMQAGADVHVKNDEGESALTLAREKGHTCIVNLLREGGAKE